MGEVAPDFPLELSQQFLSVASSMSIAMQECDIIAQHAREFASITSRWPNDYFLIPKLKEHLSGTRLYSESDVKTLAENWLYRQNFISAKPV
ncbi:hypothetical protein AVEN_116821-1 [Araneus ventricosus]|uniref:Uncharacterized protein n=1 Tax=Araneus ventricosus TaxID=182803 RepID=A0A4Y2NW84_ARAVE|nr:hypothetical protein AVEN_116821-1 [Araneus ventricosus]